MEKSKSMRKKSKERKVKCPCGAEFFTTHSQGKYCSPDCQRGGESRSWEKYRKKNAEDRGRWYREVYYPKNKDRILEKTTEYNRTKKGQETRRNIYKKQREKFPEKATARTAVMVAKRQGILKKMPCQVCGNIKTEAHHGDYKKPMDVTWLCKKHHLEHHKG